MGILINGAVIALGALLGSIFKSYAVFKSNSIFGISVMLISLGGVVENVFTVKDNTITAEHLYVVALMLTLGYFVGEWLKLDERLSALSFSESSSLNGFIDATVFFGIGGLQICGSILLAKTGDSSQLILKSIIDLPFSLMFGAIYGKAVMLSAIPVALVQVLIATVAYHLGDFISTSMIAELNSIGFIILFFSGFNMLTDTKHKIKNINMIPAIFAVIIYNALAGLWS